MWFVGCVVLVDVVEAMDCDSDTIKECELEKKTTMAEEQKGVRVYLNSSLNLYFKHTK